MNGCAGLRAALLAALCGGALACAPPALAQDGRGFQFGVIGHAFRAGPDDALLRRAIKATDQASLAFVVATGIKAGNESCSDRLYSQRKSLLDESDWPLIVSLAGSDWSACRNSLGRSNAIERLNRLREVLFADAMSLGERPMALTRLSSNAKFRSYAENAHWEHGGVLFATINLPADNNHFLAEAGRNSEFEDRLVANRAWLKRLFAMAQRRGLDGLVLFSDGDVGVQLEEKSSLLSGFNAKQDGFAEIRRQIKLLAKKFPGQVLLIDAQRRAGKEAGAALAPGQAGIDWRDNLGHASVGQEWAEIRVNPGVTPGASPGQTGPARLFEIKTNSAAAAQ